MKRLLLAVMMFAAVLTLPTQADFFQCDGDCVGTDNADLMNGSDADNGLTGGAGNDVLLGGDGLDTLSGEQGNDLLLGGNHSDSLTAGPNDDVLLPGPDGPEAVQTSEGNDGNDAFIVLVGETTNCQEIIAGTGFDALHLIGFGPYIVEHPYGQPEPIPAGSYVIIQDPVAGGFIVILIAGTNILERINGLVSPNVTVLDNADFNTFIQQNCTAT